MNETELSFLLFLIDKELANKENPQNYPKEELRWIKSFRNRLSNSSNEANEDVKRTK
jgi:hypothetical protein